MKKARVRVKHKTSHEPDSDSDSDEDMDTKPRARVEKENMPDSDSDCDMDKKPKARGKKRRPSLDQDGEEPPKKKVKKAVNYTDYFEESKRGGPRALPPPTKVKGGVAPVAKKKPAKPHSFYNHAPMNTSVTKRSPVYAPNLPDSSSDESDDEIKVLKVLASPNPDATSSTGKATKPAAATLKTSKKCPTSSKSSNKAPPAKAPKAKAKPKAKGQLEVKSKGRLAAENVIATVKELAKDIREVRAADSATIQVLKASIGKSTARVESCLESHSSSLLDLNQGAFAGMAELKACVETSAECHGQDLLRLETCFTAAAAKMEKDVGAGIESIKAALKKTETGLKKHTTQKSNESASELQQAISARKASLRTSPPFQNDPLSEARDSVLQGCNDGVAELLKRIGGDSSNLGIQGPLMDRIGDHDSVLNEILTGIAELKSSQKRLTKGQDEIKKKLEVMERFTNGQDDIKTRLGVIEQQNRTLLTASSEWTNRNNPWSGKARSNAQDLKGVAAPSGGKINPYSKTPSCLKPAGSTDSSGTTTSTTSNCTTASSDDAPSSGGSTTLPKSGTRNLENSFARAQQPPAEAVAWQAYREGRGPYPGKGPDPRLVNQSKPAGNGGAIPQNGPSNRYPNGDGAGFIAASHCIEENNRFNQYLGHGGGGSNQPNQYHGSDGFASNPVVPHDPDWLRMRDFEEDLQPPSFEGSESGNGAKRKYDQILGFPLPHGSGGGQQKRMKKAEI